MLPSEAAAIIAASHSWVTLDRGSQPLQIDSVISLGAIVAAVEGIPDELLPFGPDRTRLITALGAMHAALARWSSGGHSGFSPNLQHLPAIGGHPLTVAYQILLECPDEAPALTEVPLAFIADPNANRSIRTDMSNVDRAIGVGEWKAATVLAGSVIEALLLWAVSQHSSAAIASAAAKWKAANPGDYKKRVETEPPEEWFIGEFIEIACHLEEITDATRKAARLAGSYRNLIHPGRVLRTGADATNGTAQLASGAMREVTRDLTERHS